MGSRAKRNRAKSASAKAVPQGPSKARGAVDKWYLLLWVALFVGLFLAYGPTFTNDFVYDDRDLILHNPLVTEHQWSDIWQKDLWAETPRLSSTYYRPLVATSFALEHLVYGENSLGYHLDNLLLHCLALILLFLLVKNTFRQSRDAMIMAFMATFLFAFHPANTQIVYWVSARGDLFVAIGILLGMHCINRDGKLAAAGMLLSAFLALLSKETGVLYFLLVPLYGYFFSSREGRVKQISSRLLLLVPVVIIYVILRSQAVPFSLGTKTEESFWQPSDGTGTRLLTVPAIWGYYLLRAIFPFFLNFETNINLFYAATDWQLIAGVVAIALTVVLVLRFRKSKVFLWASFFWLISLFPFLNIFVATFESGMEHYLYLPLLAVSILVAYALPRKKATTLLFGVLMLSFAVTIFVRGKAWSNDVALWSDAASKTGVHCRQGWNRSRGNLALAHYNLAEQGVAREQNLKKAETLYKQIVEERPRFGHAWKGLGDIALQQRDYDRAESYYRKAVEYRPHDYMFRNKLGVVLLAQERYAEAREQYEKTLELNRGYPAAILNLATIHLREGNYREAERVIARMDQTDFARYPNSRAVKTAIDVANGRRVPGGNAELIRTAQVLEEMGMFEDVARLLEAVHASNQIDAATLYRLAMVYIVKLNDLEKGVRYLEEGLNRFPNDVRYMRAMAVAYEQQNQKEKAVELLERFLQVSPNHADAAAIRAHIEKLRSGG